MSGLLIILGLIIMEGVLIYIHSNKKFIDWIMKSNKNIDEESREYKRALKELNKEFPGLRNDFKRRVRL